MTKNFKNGYKFYDRNNNLLNIISCINCEICEEWKTQTWRTLEYCPVHCHNCYHIGYDDEFDIYPNPKDLSFGFFLCLNCISRIKERKKIKNLIHRSIHGKFPSFNK